MKTIVTITDITQMAPPFVCVAGVAENQRGIRLQFVESRIDEDWLCNNGVATVRPFARIGFTLLAPRPEPPHTEDWYVDKHRLEMHGRLDPAEQNSFLSSICDPSVAAIFGTEILKEPGYYVTKGQGNRSLGTVQVEQIHEIAYQNYEHGWDCRLRFTDKFNSEYVLKVKDLTLCTYLDYLRQRENLSPDQICQRLMQALGGKPCFLRIGLARGWAKFPQRCYLQVTGVFSFPDYLQGCWFADFLAPRAYRPTRGSSTAPTHVAHRITELPDLRDAYITSPNPGTATADPGKIGQVAEENCELGEPW